jgi:hypothetical protein
MSERSAIFCVALAKKLGGRVATVERGGAKLDVGIPIEVIR